MANLFHGYIQKGCLKIVEEFLNYEIDIPSLNFTPLHSAVASRQREVAELLISRGTDVNGKDEDGNTPLFYAVNNEDVNTMKLLFKNNAHFKDDLPLLKTAVLSGSKEIMELLLQQGVNVNARDKYGRTALHFAAANY